MKATPPRRIRLASAVALIGCAAIGPAPAADEPDRLLRDMKLFRIEFDNDTFIGSDDAFTAGWSVQVHSPLLDEWTPGLAGWIGRFPTLGDDGEGERIVRWSWGVTQLILTPTDVTIGAPQPDDAPWAGILGGYASWSAYDNRRLAALQMYLGCMGPCSQAEDAQKLIHNHLGLGEKPEGWSNQLDDEVLVNLTYEHRHKLWKGLARYETSGWGKRPLGGSTSRHRELRDLRASVDRVSLRWDIPRGFTKFADPPAFGIALDPVYIDPSGPLQVQRSWRPYFNVVARVRSAAEFAATEGGATQNGGFYPAVSSTPGDEQLILGVHVAKSRSRFTSLTTVTSTTTTPSERSRASWIG